MALPKPHPAQVIRYSYLWSEEAARGQDEGLKDRPCAVVLVVQNNDRGDVVTVLPITHTPPSRSQEHLAVEIPHVTAVRLGLDDQRCWIVLSEANRFVWPGPDLRMGTTGRAESVVYGLLPEGLFERVRRAFLRALEGHGGTLVGRSE